MNAQKAVWIEQFIIALRDYRSDLDWPEALVLAERWYEIPNPLAPRDAAKMCGEARWGSNGSATPE